MVLAQEEHILTWAIAAQTDDPAPSTTLRRERLDVLQADAAAAAAGHDRLVVIVGPAGTGKTTMLAAAVDDLHDHHRPVFGVAPTAKAARVLERETGMAGRHRCQTPPRMGRPRRTRPVLAATATRQRWSSMRPGCSTPATSIASPCSPTSRVGGWCSSVTRASSKPSDEVGCSPSCARPAAAIELERIHRFSNRWEAAASLQLRHGNPRALDAYLAHDRSSPARSSSISTPSPANWLDRHAAGDTTAITTTRNEHVDAINRTIQQYRLDRGDLDTTRSAPIADGDVYVGDVIATRRNQRQLHTSERTHRVQPRPVDRDRNLRHTVTWP